MTLFYWLLGIPQPADIAATHDLNWVALTPLSWPTIVAILLLGVAMAGLNFLPHTIMRWPVRLSLAAIRLAGIALLLVMLSRLELQMQLQRKLPPTVAVLTDTSASMTLEDVNGKSRLDAARDFVEGPLAALKNKNELVAYQFDWQLTQESSSKQSVTAVGITRLVDAVAETAQREANLQAIVMLTDGNDTTGNNGQLLAPLLAARGLPVYPLVIGEAGEPKLARINLAPASVYCRLGDEFRLTATLTLQNLGAQVATVNLRQQGQDKPIAVRENVKLGDQPVDVSFVVKPERAGEHVFRIDAEGIGKTVTRKLLSAEHRVLVVDQKIKVLYVDVPRDERKILQHWLSRDPVVDLATLTLLPKGGWYAQGVLQHPNAGDGLPNAEADLYKYDVIIFGDIPRSYFRSGGDAAETKLQRLVEFCTRRGGGLVTLGGRNAYAAGQYQDSALAGILPFAIDGVSEPQVPKKFLIQPTAAGLSHPLMALDANPQANREAWFDLPTLDGSNRVGKLKPSATLLAQRQEGDEVHPVMAIHNVGKGKVLSLAIDTTWRWEMQRADDRDDYYRRFWGNTIRYLAPDPRVSPGNPQIVRHQSHATVGETLELSTRLVDGIYQPIRGGDVQVKVTSPSGKITIIYPRDGRSSPGLYEYQVPLTEAGTWEVATTFQGKSSIEKIEAGELGGELDDPRARPDRMAELAKATGGRSAKLSDGEQLIAAMDLKPRIIEQQVAVALWNRPLTMVALLSLVCLDCFIRKRRGMV